MITRPTINRASLNHGFVNHGGGTGAQPFPFECRGVAKITEYNDPNEAVGDSNGTALFLIEYLILLDYNCQILLLVFQVYQF